ncbi:hypothetical protein N7539_004148 [Penicillium diatomitis]|uniref:Uncharacterized protein n=1 Tax=Penicillium diatomitis TaxID=2819901 RepID=A0A9W9XDX8_9EURO|nr:uncharacterized protein N7539_004148 [Penicillium diatomitis]KAJ5489258.1 hypothetical protein N7539_004148 [Penicillium diatomitis]
MAISRFDPERQAQVPGSRQTLSRMRRKVKNMPTQALSAADLSATLPSDIFASSRPNMVRPRRGLVSSSRETVVGELWADLRREGWTGEADAVEAAMKIRAEAWDMEAVPYGSEMAWDSTGQEGIYYWSKCVSGLGSRSLGNEPSVPDQRLDGVCLQ